MKDNALLEVSDLEISFSLPTGLFKAVSDVSFKLTSSKNMALVGESGCGKTLTALSLLRLIQKPGIISKGAIKFFGQDLLAADDQEIQSIRGKKISMIFQEPMTSLNPVFTVGEQVAEMFRIHFGDSKKESTLKAIEMLDKVKIPSPQKRFYDYPHQLSGGMRQRVMIAMALACKPQLLIADEPTTALDVTVQAQILDLLQELQDEVKMGILFITHDLGLVAEFCHDVLVMYAGRIIEKGHVEEFFEGPKHPYSRALLASVPKIGRQMGPFKTISGSVPAIKDISPEGCSFHDRCPSKLPRCSVERPKLVRLSSAQEASCLLYEDHNSSEVQT